MKRKINLVGTNTLTVSLPNKWAKRYNIKKGDEIEMSEDGNEIILNASKEKKGKGKEITLDISHLNKYLLMRYLEVLYITNYNKIIVTYSTSQVYDDKHMKYVPITNLIKWLSDRFIGMEIVSQTKNSTEFECFLLDEEKNLDKVEKRVFFLLKETLEELLLSIEKNYKEFHQLIYDHHDNIIKFIIYYLRVLDQSDKNEEEKKQLYALFMIIDKMVDKLRHLSDMINEYNCSTRIKKILSDIFNFIYEQFHALHTGKITPELVSKRYQLIKKVEKEQFTPKELRVINEVKIFLDTINDFSRAIIIKEVTKLS